MFLSKAKVYIGVEIKTRGISSVIATLNCASSFSLSGGFRSFRSASVKPSVLKLLKFEKLSLNEPLSGSIVWLECKERINIARIAEIMAY